MHGCMHFMSGNRYVPPWQGHFAVQGERTVLMCMTCVQVNANYQATLSGNKNAIISYSAA